MRELKSETKQTMNFSLSEARRRLEQRRDELVRLRRQQQQERAELIESRAQDSGDQVVRDLGIDTYDQLEEGEQKELKAIDAALVRVEDGSYGTCIDCGEPIDPERLEALPYTPRCVACAEAAPPPTRPETPSTL